MSAQMRHTVPHEWQGLLSALTTQRSGHPVTVEMLSAERGRQLMADRDPLAHITYLSRDDAVVVSVQGTASHQGVGLEHVVARPWKIRFEPPSIEAVRTIDIEGVDGALTRVTLHEKQVSVDDL